MEEKIKSLLISTKREGMPELIRALEGWDFFNSPASMRFHGSYKGGLMVHSHCVLKTFFKQAAKLRLIDEKISPESIIICSLLHDVCKAGLYIPELTGFSFNSVLGRQGHAKLSIKRIEEYIKLTDQEKNIIKYHMGYFGTHEFSKYNQGEYSLDELSKADKITRLFHWCDDEDSSFRETKL